MYYLICRETILSLYHIISLIGNDLMCGFLIPTVFLLRLRTKMPEFFMDDLPIKLSSSFYVHPTSHLPRDQWTKNTPMFEIAKSKPRIICVQEAPRDIPDHPVLTEPDDLDYKKLALLERRPKSC